MNEYTVKPLSSNTWSDFAALLYDGSTCVGWCQCGPRDELPRLKHRRAYMEGLAGLPDWRITCFFVDRDYRHKGVASLALAGALQEIGRLGGGTVESCPEDVQGRSVSGSFLYNATVSMFEQQGFRRVRRLGKNHWVVSKIVRRRMFEWRGSALALRRSFHPKSG